MLTYVGRGYSPAFTSNFDAIAGRLNRGEDIEIVDGPDDICVALAGEAEAHCRGESVIERDRQAARDLHGLFNTPVAVGARLSLEPDRLSRMRAAFASGNLRNACAGCQWSDLCDSIAGGGYHGVRVGGPAG